MALTHIAHIGAWPFRRWIAAVVAAAATLVFVGVPSTLVPNPWFTRMTPITWWDWPIWAATGILGGLLIATFVTVPLAAAGAAPAGSAASVASGGLLSTLAVGCPTCNKFVVALAGTTGALSLWAPLQPVVGLASVALLIWSLRRRLNGESSCALPRPDEPQGEQAAGSDRSASPAESASPVSTR